MKLLYNKNLIQWMDRNQVNGPCCFICKIQEGELTKLYSCESCFQVFVCSLCELQIVCTHCSMYRSPIPFMGKQKLVRVCNYCIYCYSNCEFSQIKNFTYVPESQSRDRNSYSEFAESRCCKDLYVRSYVYFLWLSLIDYSTQRKRTRFFPLLLL